MQEDSLPLQDISVLTKAEALLMGVEEVLFTCKQKYKYK